MLKFKHTIRSSVEEGFGNCNKKGEKRWQRLQDEWHEWRRSTRPFRWSTLQSCSLVVSIIYIGPYSSDWIETTEMQIFFWENMSDINVIPKV